jgi:tetratricopeptide (TPR) repeat protein
MYPVALAAALLVSCVPAFLSAAPSSPATPAAGDARLQEGIRLHDAARADKTNLAKAKETLAALKDSSPLALAYYGSAVTLEASVANDRKDVLKALSLLNQGSGYIDAAVKKDPENFDIHFLRMENSYEVSVSSPVNRFKEMKADIDWLTARESSLDAQWRGTLELYRGLYLAKAHKLDEALAAFDKCIAVSPGSPEAKEAQKQLDHYAE